MKTVSITTQLRTKHTFAFFLDFTKKWNYTHKNFKWKLKGLSVVTQKFHETSSPLLSVTILWPLTCEHVPASACSALATFLHPSDHPSFHSFPAGRRPDLGGKRPQLSEHPARGRRQGTQIVTAPDDDGERRRPPAARQDGCRRDQVDRQFADRREFCQQQHGQVSPHILKTCRCRDGGC